MNIVEQTETSATTAAAERSVPTSEPTAPISSTTKSSAVIKLLSRAKGATQAEISHATGWQPHSCRAFLTGLRKKRENLIKEQRSDGSTAYRIVAKVSAVAAP